MKMIADKGLNTPKSTYIEPKLRSGVTIYNSEKEERKREKMLFEEI